MATSTGAFFAGIGTTFVVLAVGFGGGLMMAKSALKESGGYQTRAASEALTPVRVILPNSAEAGQPPPQPQPQASSPPAPATQTTLQSAKQALAPVEKQVEKADTRKSEVEEHERKRRYAERKARRQAEARARQQRERQRPREREDAPVVAFSGDSSPRLGDVWVGN
jgi:type IV secretory pathway VirB10-like protein